MKILLVSSSARGHAIADALKRSTSNPDIVSVCASKNPGIGALASEQHVIDLSDTGKIVEIAKNVQPDFAFIGPEDPLALGTADALAEIGIASVGPKQSLARIEASKGFTRDLCTKHGIDASPAYKLFTNDNKKEIEAFLDQLGGDYVVKYDALKGGKGVKVSGEHLEGIQAGVDYALECIDECGHVCIEEKLVGVEFSLISFVSGTQVVDTPAVQDHKRAYEGDTGPNTGGMGTWSAANHSLPFLTEADITRAKEINRETAQALMDECGDPYKGLLYGGFIAVKDGVKLIEYNCRFGDPEALNILSLLSSDFVDISQAIINGELTDDLVSFENQATVCKYITPAGYPDNKDQRGETIVFPDVPANAKLYLGDIDQQDDGSLTLGGSRTAGIVGIGDSIEEAEKIAQDFCEAVEGPIRFRSDIGTQELVEKRNEMIKELRG